MLYFTKEKFYNINSKLIAMSYAMQYVECDKSVLKEKKKEMLSFHLFCPIIAY